MVALDGDTNNLTFSDIFKNEHPNRFVECYIAQQNMVLLLSSFPRLTYNVACCLRGFYRKENKNR